MLQVSVLLLIKKLLLISLRNITFATGEINVQEAHSLGQVYTTTVSLEIKIFPLHFQKHSAFTRRQCENNARLR